MKYEQPFDQPTNPNASYVNGNPATGTPGSIPSAASFENHLRELVEVITDSGQTPSAGDLKQVAKAIQSGKLTYGADTSTTLGQVTVALTPTLPGYQAGQRFLVLMNNACVGATNINIDAHGNKVIAKSPGSQPLVGAEWAAGDLVELRFDGTLFQASGLGQRPPLSANTTIYVNDGIGSDTLYDGTSATVSGTHGPLKTLTKACAVCFAYGPGPFVLTVQVAAGTYTTASNVFITPNYPGPGIVINGAGVGSTIVGGANNTHTFEVNGPNSMTVQNLTASAGSTGGPPSVFVAQGGAIMTTQNTASGSAGYAVHESYQASINVGTHTFNTGTLGQSAFVAAAGGTLNLIQGAVFTISGALTVTEFALAGASGTIAVPSIGVPTFVNPSNVTGAKYLASLNGVINTQGQGGSYFPGSVGGSVSSGGQYA